MGPLIKTESGFVHHRPQIRLLKHGNTSWEKQTRLPKGDWLSHFLRLYSRQTEAVKFIQSRNSFLVILTKNRALYKNRESCAGVYETYNEDEVNSRKNTCNLSLSCTSCFNFTPSFEVMNKIMSHSKSNTEKFLLIVILELSPFPPLVQILIQPEFQMDSEMAHKDIDIQLSEEMLNYNFKYLNLLKITLKI